MRGVAVLALLLLVITRQEVNADSTIAPSTGSEGTANTEAPGTGSPGTTKTEAPGTGSPDTTKTEAPGTGSPDTTKTEAPGTGSPDTTKTEAPGTGSPDTTKTEAPSTGSPGTTKTEAPSTGSPGTAKTEAPGTGPPDTTKTEAPGTGSPATTKTEAPGTGSPATTKTEAPGTGPPDTTKTEAPGTGSPLTVQTNNPNATITKTDSVPSTSKPGTCSPASCMNGSVCIQLNNKYECRCPLNYHPDNQTCRAGESFYGELTIIGVEFNSNPESKEYTEIYDKVMNQSNVALIGFSSYLGTVILEMRSVSSKSQTRGGRGPTDVVSKVSNVFRKDAVTAEEVHGALGTLTGAFSYTRRSICDGFYCDAETTICAPTADGQGASCTCKEGNFSSSSVPEVTSCRDCDPKCYQEEGAYCNLESEAGWSCACTAGYKRSGGKCQTCDFGYSGENCADNFLLILVIVGAVLGAAVVALLGAVIGITVSSKKGKKSGDRTTLIEKDEAPLSGGSPARLFPKVQAKTDLGEVNKGANVFDDYEEYSRNFPKRDYEENPWYEMDKKDRNY